MCVCINACSVLRNVSCFNTSGIHPLLLFLSSLLRSALCVLLFFIFAYLLHVLLTSVIFSSPHVLLSSFFLYVSLLFLLPISCFLFSSFVFSCVPLHLLSPPFLFLILFSFHSPLPLLVFLFFSCFLLSFWFSFCFFFSSSVFFVSSPLHSFV